MNNTTFKPGELTLEYHEWTRLVNSRRDTLSEETKEWLSAWEKYDALLENVPDDILAYIRSGHFIGYYQATQNTGNKND